MRSLRALLLPPLLLGSAYASGKSNVTKKCRHGRLDPVTDTCHCYDGWGTAGITDTYQFLQGVCEQYHCESNQKCEQALGIEGATCPVPGWNCYCGWQYAFSNFGHGWETPDGQGGGECMGVMYTFSIWATGTLGWCMSWMWKFFLPLAVIALPFGRKRAICDHHWPSLWNGIRRACGFPRVCDGSCVMNSRHTLDTFKDDIAWSLYILDIGAWFYIFMATVYVIALLIWSFLLWLAVLVVLVVGAISMMVMSCGEGLSECGGCNCCSCEGAGCCDFGVVHGYDSLAAGNSVYQGGMFPYDPFWGYNGFYPHVSGAHDCCCDCCCEREGGCCKQVCWPVAWLCFVFPVLPENAWGGFCGYFLWGTHHRTPPERLYQGGSSLIDFMSMNWRRRADLHGDDQWRMQVYAFLSGDGPEFLQHSGTSAAQPQPQAQPRAPTTTVNELGQTVLELGRAHAICVSRTFNQEEDRCVPSSFEDYEKNVCWICTQSNDEWDLWMSCHHLFCKDCSTQMLKRRMPCPLCRVSSSTVLRGKAPSAPVVLLGMERPRQSKPEGHSRGP